MRPSWHLSISSELRSSCKSAGGTKFLVNYYYAGELSNLLLIFNLSKLETLHELYKHIIIKFSWLFLTHRISYCFKILNNRKPTAVPVLAHLGRCRAWVMRYKVSKVKMSFQVGTVLCCVLSYENFEVSHFLAFPCFGMRRTVPQFGTWIIRIYFITW